MKQIVMFAAIQLRTLCAGVLIERDNSGIRTRVDIRICSPSSTVLFPHKELK